MPRKSVKILLACRPEFHDEFSLSLQSLSNCEIAGRSHNEVDLVRMAGALKPDVVIIHHEPPHMDGREIALRLRDEPQQAKLLMLVSEPHEFFGLLETRANGFETFPAETLSRSVEAIMETGYWIGPSITRYLLSGCGFELLRYAGDNMVDHTETISSLSVREKEVLSFLRSGLTNQEIADRMKLRVGTVKVHVKHILAKLNMDHRGQAIARFATGTLGPE